MWVLLFGNIWTECGSINHVKGQVFEFTLSHLHEASCVQYVAYIYIPKSVQDMLQENSKQSQKRNRECILICVLHALGQCSDPVAYTV